MYVCYICWKDSNKLWYEYYATGGNPKFILFDIQEFLIPHWYMDEISGWVEWRVHHFWHASGLYSGNILMYRN